MQLVGIDLGGTKIEGVVTDSADLSRPLCRLRLSTEADQGYEHILRQIAKLHGLLAEEVGGKLPAVVGIGTPGSLDMEAGTLQGSNTQCLNGKPFKADLEKILGIEVRMANDANCFALAEALMGAAKGYETVFGIIMGTD